MTGSYPEIKGDVKPRCKSPPKGFITDEVLPKLLLDSIDLVSKDNHVLLYIWGNNVHERNTQNCFTLESQERAVFNS